MRVEVSEEAKGGASFKRGDYALAVLDGKKVLKLQSVHPVEASWEANTEIIEFAYKLNLQVYECQFLSESALSVIGEVLTPQK